MTNVMKWAAAFAAVAGMAFGVIGNDGGTAAFASPPEDDHGDDHGGLLWEPGDSNVYIAESPEVRAILEGTAIRPQAAVDITVNYIGTWTSDQQTALERAVTIWESVIEGTGPIVIDASINNGLTSIGQGGPQYSTFSGQPLSNTWYPLALINQIRGLDHNPALPEINLAMRITGVNWHYGAGNAPANTVDFTSVALHEIGHGLGFSDTFACSPNAAPCTGQITFGTSSGTGNPVLHDTFAVSDPGSVLLISLAKLSAALKSAVTGSGVYFNGAFAKANNNNNAPRLYAPAPFTGANVSHLDENTYNGTVNALMTPTFTGNETVRDPGPIMRGMLKDYGYTVTEPAPSTGTIQFLQTGSSVTELAGSANVAVTRSNGTSGAASATCAVTGGTATAVLDYAMTVSSVSWADGESGTKNCTLSIVNDGGTEPQETINLGLQSITGATAGTPATTVVSIQAHSEPSQLAFYNPSVVISEDSLESAVLPISRTGNLTGSIGVTCVVTGGTAQGGNFSLQFPVVTWGSGDNALKGCVIDPVNDLAVNGTRTVQVSLQTPTGTPTPLLISPTTATVTILDDDVAGGTIAFRTATTGYFSEDDGTVEIAVSRTGSTGAVTATCTFQPGSSTATNLLDFTIQTNTVSWADGDTSVQYCEVAIIDDILEGEGTESIVLSLTGLTGGAVAGTPSTTTIYVEDNDPPLLVFVASPSNGYTGEELPGQPVVEIQNQFGNTLTDQEGNITLSVSMFGREILPAPTSSCAQNPVAASVAVAQFGGCYLTLTGRGSLTLRLKAEAPGMATGYSEQFTIIDPRSDITCDGSTDAIDALAMMRVMAGFTEEQPTMNAPCTGDMDGDSDLDMVDVLRLRQFLVAFPPAN